MLRGYGALSIDAVAHHLHVFSNSIIWIWLAVGKGFGRNLRSACDAYPERDGFLASTA